MSENENYTGENETVAESHSANNDQDRNWAELRESAKRMKEEKEALSRQVEVLQQQNQLIMANLQKPQVEQQPQAPQDLFAGLESDDVVSVDAVRKALSTKDKEYQTALGQIEARFDQVTLAQQYPDFNEVLKEALPKLQADPETWEAICTSKKGHLLAYRLGRQMVGSQQQSKSEVTQQEVSKALENAQKPQAPKTGTGTGGLGRADYINSMSDNDFEAIVNRVKSGAA